MKYYYYQNGYNHGWAAVKDADGNYVFYDTKTKQPNKQVTDQIIRSAKELTPNWWEEYIEGRSFEAKVNSLEELFQWIQKFKELSSEVESAETLLANAKGRLDLLLHPMTHMSLTEYRDKGYTYQVLWNYMPQTNPETNDDWFTREKAEEALESMKTENLDEFDEDSCYVYDASDELDDQIDDETADR